MLQVEDLGSTSKTNECSRIIAYTYRIVALLQRDHKKKLCLHQGGSVLIGV